MGICYKLFSLYHRRVLDLGKAGRWLPETCSWSGPLPEFGLARCYLVTPEAVQEALKDAQEAHQAKPNIWYEASEALWPWKQIIDWMAELGGDDPIYLMADNQDLPEPWRTEPDWTKETIYRHGNPPGWAVWEGRTTMRPDFAISKITVLITHGTDLVRIHTNMAPPVPRVSDQPLVLQFEAEKGTGIEYVRTHFGVEPNVINTMTGKVTGKVTDAGTLRDGS